jgi:FkbM family methyltransferase
MREITVRLLRTAFRWWPFMRGRGRLLWLSRVLLGNAPVRFAISDQVWIAGPLSDWMILWTFMCQHERDEPFQRSLELLTPSAVAIDVGAHVGVWSLLAAERSPTASIHAFEPTPAIVERLRHHLRLNGASGVVVNPVAVGSEPGRRPFFVADNQNSGASSFYARRPEAAEISVAVDTLDDYIERHRLQRIGIVKVDVEGAEMLVFSGACRLLSSPDAPVVFFELNDDLCASSGVAARDVKQHLVDFGYGIYRWRQSRFTNVSLDESHYGEDLFAMKPQHLGRLAQP